MPRHLSWHLLPQASSDGPLLCVQAKLVQHTYSCLYGSFLCNNARERQARNVYKRTCSVWSLLRGGNKNFQNFLYIPSHDMVQ